MNNEIQFILYQLPDEEGRVQVVIKDETIWIFEEGELDKDVVVSKMEITTQHGAIEGKRWVMR